MKARSPESSSSKPILPTRAAAEADRAGPGRLMPGPAAPPAVAGGYRRGGVVSEWLDGRASTPSAAQTGNASANWRTRAARAGRPWRESDPPRRQRRPRARRPRRQAAPRATADTEGSSATPPLRSARTVAPSAEGLQVGGVAATAKHLPGLGTAIENTDQNSQPQDLILRKPICVPSTRRPTALISPQAAAALRPRSATYLVLSAPVLPPSPSIATAASSAVARLPRANHH